MKTLHVTHHILTFVDPVLNEPYGHTAVRVAPSYKNPRKGEIVLDRVQRYNLRRLPKNPARQFVMGPK